VYVGYLPLDNLNRGTLDAAYVLHPTLLMNTRNVRYRLFNHLS